MMESRRILHAILALLLIGDFALGAECEHERARSNVDDLINSAQAASNQFFTSDIAEFCRESATVQTEKLNAFLPETFLAGRGWSLSIYPDLNRKTQAYIDGMSFYYGINSLEANQAYLKNNTTANQNQFSSGFPRGTGFGFHLNALRSMPPTINTGGLQHFNLKALGFWAESEGLCAQLTLPGFQCAADLQNIARNYEPRGSI